jgi:hypothetical protein
MKALIPTKADIAILLHNPPKNGGQDKISRVDYIAVYQFNGTNKK